MFILFLIRKSFYLFIILIFITFSYFPFTLASHHSAGSYFALNLHKTTNLN